MFAQLDLAPPNPILGLDVAFQSEANPNKINLGVGVFKDAENRTPILKCVKRAEELLLQEETTKSYLGIPGSPAYGAEVQRLLFGPGHEILESRRAHTAQTPGGTGALRVAGDFIYRANPGATVWLSEPTWANHPQIFKAAGVAAKTYPYYDYAAKELDFDAMLEALAQVPAGDVVLFHGCCHNPSGMDPNLQQWAQLQKLSQEREFLPLFDFAYQGFGDGLEEDAAGLRLFCDAGQELLICSSFSKNFGLYNERVGALTVVGQSADAADRAFSQVKIAVRANYSNPPAHGGAIITRILSEPELRLQWEQELAMMRNRIHEMRELFVETLRDKGVATDFSFLTRQKGMFSFSGLTPEQVKALRDQYAIYMVATGRINVAGITPANMEPLCSAIAAVMAVKQA